MSTEEWFARRQRRLMSRRALLKRCGAGLGGAVLLGAAGCARGAGSGMNEAEHTIRFSFVTAESTPKGQGAARFAELVEERSDGRIAVQLYPNGELYDDVAGLEAMQDGSVEMLSPATAKFTSIAPRVQVLDLPFLFDSVDEVPDVFSRDTSVGRSIIENQELENRGIRVMGLWDSGLKQLSSNTQIRVPADMAGLEFRIQPSDVLRSQFQAWGARSTIMPFSEVYNALEQGVIDGQENPYGNIEGASIHTAQGYITESRHGYIGYPVVMNDEFYRSLPSDLQGVVDEAVHEASVFVRDRITQINDEALQAIRAEEGAAEIIVPTEMERQQLKDAVVPSVWEEYRGLFGDDVIAELLERDRARGR